MHLNLLESQVSEPDPFLEKSVVRSLGVQLFRVIWPFN